MVAGLEFYLLKHPYYAGILGQVDAGPGMRKRIRRGGELPGKLNGLVTVFVKIYF
jgi:hypothetical protein